MDEDIERVARVERTIGLLEGSWAADRVRVDLGLARVLRRGESPPLGSLARILPGPVGYLRLIVDVPTGAESPIYDALVRSRA